jgi:integrase
MTIPIGRSKNGEGRTFPFADLPELKAVLTAQWEAKTELERARGCVIPWVFFRVSKAAVSRIKSYKNAWRAATRRAGVPGKWVHDFRRCAARALRDSAVPESVAMSLLGHKTPSMFRRYQITNDADKKAGVEKLAAYHAQRAGLQDSLRDNLAGATSDEWSAECVTS